MTRSTPATPLARRRTVLGAALLASAALSVGLLSACGAGQITGTDTQVAAVPGVSVKSADGLIAVQDAAIVYAGGYKAGSTVPISVRIFNNAKQPVKLTGVSAAGAGTVVLVGGQAAAAAAAPAQTSTSPSPSTSRKPSGSPSGVVSANAAPSTAAPTEAPAGSPQINIPIPVAGFVALSPDTKTYLAISKLTDALEAGAAQPNVVFTFTYADGKTTTATLPELPMSPPLSPLPKPSAVVQNEEHGE
ncbi:hypothetical protein KZZ52_01390 [Dactylosporangium sp. AC04546]|uniref:hypothetical protein n=1 Tax=Dactylosporangium sp. AC04546 TaxID=2862460 RepID=UPI001EDCC1A1|nr:hypothetical protein [Dactylosporangium sp. AC04546]WVK84122.1 hypothetical protein KZZ52_01390 [Dactylosporangium sp. AC04546]